MIMNRAALVEQIQEAKKTLEKLLTRFQSAPIERDRFVPHFYRAQGEHRRTCKTAGKSGKQIERCHRELQDRREPGSGASFANRRNPVAG